MDTSPRCTSLLLGMLSKWRTQVADSLGTEDPLVLLRLLDFVDATDGMSQAELNRKLVLNQSRLCKLVRKLIRGGYLDESHSRLDRRLQLLKADKLWKRSSVLPGIEDLRGGTTRPSKE